MSVLCDSSGQRKLSFGVFFSFFIALYIFTCSYKWIKSITFTVLRVTPGFNTPSCQSLFSHSRPAEVFYSSHVYKSHIQVLFATQLLCNVLKKSIFLSERYSKTYSCSVVKETVLDFRHCPPVCGNPV